MRPVERRMMYEPGTFVFVRVPNFKGRERELHPFSISSSPLQHHLRVSIRQVGDFTRQVSYLSLGEDNPDYWKARRPGKYHATSTLRRHEIDVFGPFGGFTPFRFEKYERMVWVGAGIGITPFLSMLAFERSTLDFRRVSLYYVARTAEDAVYDREIREHRTSTSDFVEYVLWVTREQGRLTAARIAEGLEDDDYAVMLCGTRPFVEAFVEQFRELGLPNERIITEELQFR
jgi:predicted ferric reductase